MKETVYNTDKENVSEVELKDEIFGARVNKALIYETVKMQRACMRQGDAFCKNRTLVSGTTAKMYRQKGTGRARHGDARANIFVGGGKAFGPKPRDYGYAIPKKAKILALKSVLSQKKKEGKILIVDDFKMQKPKTKDAVEVLLKFGIKNGLLVVNEHSENVVKSFRNIPDIKLVKSESLTVFDLMGHEHVVITLPALEKIQSLLG